MPFPKLSTSRIDPQVQNILQAYTNNDFIADKVLPTVLVTEEAGKIPAIGNDHLRVYKNKRALWDESSHRMSFTYDNSTDSYQIEYYDVDVYVPDRLQSMAQKPFMPRRDAGIVALQQIMLEREDALATTLGDNTVITNYTTLSGSSQYSDPSSTPVSDIETARTTIYNATGSEANAMVIGRAVFNTLKTHPDFVDKIRSDADRMSGSTLLDLMADLFEIPRENIYIGKSIKISSNMGQTETKAAVWGSDIVVFKKADAGNLFQPSAGYSFKLQGDTMRASTRRHENDFGDIERVEMAYDDVIVDVNSIYLIEDAV